MWDALAVAFVWGFEELAYMVIRRMTGFRYNLLPFCDSRVLVETLHDVSEKQALFDTSFYAVIYSLPISTFKRPRYVL